jgi:hypothetical protein
MADPPAAVSYAQRFGIEYANHPLYLIGVPLSIAGAIFLYRQPQINLDKLIEIWFFTDTAVVAVSLWLTATLLGIFPDSSIGRASGC